MSKLWRCNLKTSSSKNIDPAKFCIENGIVGIGWKLDQAPTSKEDYWEQARIAYKAFGRSWSAAANVLLYRMQVDDLVWSRNSKAQYFLGRIVSDWEYSDSQKHLDADVINFRKCHWVKVGTVDNVPGSVVNSFIPSATVQAVNDATAKNYSKILFNEHSPQEIFEIEPFQNPDILSLLSDEDLEDAVGIFLQIYKNYVLFPSTCKSDTQFVEFILRSRSGDQTAGVQVKSGKVPLNPEDYLGFEETVYLFAASGKYGPSVENTVCLNPDTIRDFILSNVQLLPKRIQRWVRAFNNCAS
ncbi:MAG: hypothetical protein P8J27_05905 [Mariniblastus sp.]|nr:hypothetical protein [Mariniblastus sp.]